MIFVEEEIYHVCQKGVDGRIIFPGNSYFQRFLLGMRIFNSWEPAELRNFNNNTDVQRPEKEKLVEVLAYILMNNHAHILFRCRTPEGATEFVRKIFGGYVKYFNLRNKRKGVLFQGRAKVIRVDSDRYFQHLVNYIHLNALDYTHPQWRGGRIKRVLSAKAALLRYPWSSLLGIVGKKDDLIISRHALEEFLNPEELIDSMLKWSERDQELLGEQKDYLEP
ncbi:MAG: transposase [Candidatus Niyogibacteria bacterium]|nr:MAG: transposase [Candidatus Niyogibacteria bacterium]